MRTNRGRVRLVAGIIRRNLNRTAVSRQSEMMRRLFMREMSISSTLIDFEDLSGFLLQSSLAASPAGVEKVTEINNDLMHPKS
ncbi:MAG: hypothetical protein WA213_12495 [Terriglobales bacterium]